MAVEARIAEAVGPVGPPSSCSRSAAPRQARFRLAGRTQSQPKNGYGCLTPDPAVVPLSKRLAQCVVVRPSASSASAWNRRASLKEVRQVARPSDLVRGVQRDHEHSIRDRRRWISISLQFHGEFPHFLGNGLALRFLIHASSP
jgi:hypothetical protein